MSKDNNKRNIITFACDKWGYAAADLTGTTRKSYDTDVNIIRVRCTGRVGIHLIMDCFLNGADGVAIISWKEGECEFGNGNMVTYKHLSMLKKIFDHLGISDERIQQYFCSAADVEKFVNSVKDIHNRIHKLPPISKKTE